jgi:hypothetical protein
MSGRTGQTVAAVLYPVPQASGDLLGEIFIVSPHGYLCAPPGCFDQVTCDADCLVQIPTRHGRNRAQFLLDMDVGLFLDSELKLNPADPASDPFVLSGDLPAHPKNHFGKSGAITTITQIAEAYLDNQPGCEEPVNRPTFPKLKINDISLVRGGVYDLNKQWFGNNTTGNGHWGHRTGTEVDIDTEDSQHNDTSCTAGGGGNDRVEKAVKKVIKRPLVPTMPQGVISFGPVFAHKCEPRKDMPGGKNHVYLQ